MRQAICAMNASLYMDWFLLCKNCFPSKPLFFAFKLCAHGQFEAVIGGA
jgi:hypothetical protein